ncbi:hypothetical protein AB0H00_30005 [Nocardia sp. NPDC023852]|uniref:hypothetical protein n=1 Tax=Nocardia sp. NPDC023852 TaxID=3154697 RepID=UPI0033ECF67B
MASLFPLPPLRLELPEDVYTDVSACWWSRERWVAHNLALYDEHYELLRAQAKVDSVGRRTFEHYLIAESGGADFATGRNSRVTINQLQAVTRRSESTMHRCRRLTKAFATRTVVFAGRHRTLAERLDSWRRGDRCRGWAAVSVLHESPTLPVDNETVETLLDQGFGTPPPRSGGSLSLSRPSSVPSPQNRTKGRAPRGHDKKGKPKRPRAYDPRALLLASHVRSDARFPLWLRRLGIQGLAAVLTRRALAGWQADDVHAALDEVYLSGRKIYDRPRDPYAYLAWLLSSTPVDEPPMLLDRARAACLELERQARQRAENEQRRAEAIAKVVAAPDSPARGAAVAAAAKAGHRAISSAATTRAAAEAARREIARMARED